MPKRKRPNKILKKTSAEDLHKNLLKKRSDPSLNGKKVIFDNQYGKILTGVVVNKIYETILIKWEDSPIESWICLDSPCLVSLEGVK